MISKNKAIFFLMILVTTVSQSGCAVLDPSSGDCLSCFPNFYKFGVTCIEGNTSCLSFASNGTGNCIECNPGFSPSKDGSSCITNCAAFNGSACTACNLGHYYLRSNGICTLGNPLCAIYDSNGNCTSCNSGFIVSGGTCLRKYDPQCSNLAQSGCSDCKIGFYISNGVCSLGDPLCASYGVNGVCSSCYFGYQVSGTTCVLSHTTQNTYCSRFISSVCVVCKNGYYINNSTGICTLGNPLCVTFLVKENGACATCYVGYTLIGVLCILITPTPPIYDPYCSSHNGSVCTACYSGYYVNISGICAVANPVTPTPPIYDPYCLSHNGSVCTACYSGYYVNISGICAVANPLCLTIASNGSCLSCYSNYVITGATCAPPALWNDPYCLTHNSSACTVCVAGYYVNSNGGCAVASPRCKSYDMIGGACLTCPLGYSLSSGRCI